MIYENRVCTNCNKAFEIRKSRLTEKGRGKFCSQKCFHIFNRGENSHFFGVKKRGENNQNWKGNKVCYVAFHMRVVQVKGKPKRCEYCGVDDQNTRYEWANLTGKYQDVNDYVRLCVRCHREKDGTMPINRYTQRKELYTNANI